MMGAGAGESLMHSLTVVDPRGSTEISLMFCPKYSKMEDLALCAKASQRVVFGTFRLPPLSLVSMKPIKGPCYIASVKHYYYSQSENFMSVSSVVYYSRCVTWEIEKWMLTSEMGLALLGDVGDETYLMYKGVLYILNRGKEGADSQRTLASAVTTTWKCKARYVTAGCAETLMVKNNRLEVNLLRFVQIRRRSPV
ncbi:mitochondrial carrier (BOU / S-adenosylmethionine carrier) [Gracilaria domingensis]|nr:mitochondrial carrier (BOU / S-adenosylmethionine carrier) [Gracilaria domingensis]